MFDRGLKPKELDRLASAGAAPALVDAVAAEAQTLRWLFLLRGWDWFILPAIGAAISLAATIYLDVPDWIAQILNTAGPAIAGLLLAAPHLEVRAMRRHEPVRWAARRLALLAVQALPEWGDDGDRQWRTLQRLLAAGEGFDHPRSALRAIARTMQQPAPKSLQGEESRFRLNGALALNQTNANMLSLVALALAVSALVMMAVLKFS